MPIKKLTLGLCLLLSGAAVAQQKTYTVCNGDTLSAIANRLNVPTRDILRANALTSANRLKLGQKLRIPTKTVYSDRNSTKIVSGGSYVVRNGDHDWAIAKKHGTTPVRLRQMNPGVNWRSLQIGQRLRVPGGAKAHVASGSTPSKRAIVSGTSGKVVVRNGDNDWIIARRLGITPTQLRSLNAGVRWNRLQPGQVLRAPGGTVAKASTAAPAKLRSRHAVVVASMVTVRQAPKTNASKVASAGRGTRVTVLDRDSGWYKLQFPHGTVGWVRGDLLKSAPAPAPQRVAQATRRRPKTVQAPRQVRTPQKPTYYAMNVASTGSGNSVVNKAKSFRGVRYRYGAASRSGTDCSGFTTQVFSAHGVRLPRTSSDQARVGKPVSRGALKEGDLVFFRTTRGRRISHVGIYMGNGKFIHASSGGGRVQVNSLGDGYYSKRFVTARRVTSTKSVAKKPTATAKAAAKPAVVQDAAPAAPADAAPDPAAGAENGLM